MRGAIFRDMALAYSQLEDLHALRGLRSQMRANSKLAVGRDYRNRTLLGPYATKTGRCAWGTTKFIWGPSRGLRLAIAPPPGAALIYRDFRQQEVRIAAVKSGDTELLAACEAEDVYLAVAHQLGFDESDDDGLRARFKVVLLSIQYGAEAASLAIRAGISPYEASEILARLRARFRRYEEYCASVADHAGLDMVLSSEFGWTVKVPPDTNRRTIRNWPTQTCGSEILHVAVLLAERRGLSVIAPPHDALMCEGDPAHIVDLSHELDRCMGDASAIVLRGYRIPTEEGQAMGPLLSRPRTGPIYPGEHYYDKAGARMWNEVNRLIDNLLKQRA
jgi:DNA polymerase family A